MSRLRSILTVLAVAAAGLAGCDDGGATVPGEAGRGTFEYICVDGEAAAHCRDLFSAIEFPEVFAVGGRFWTRFSPEDGGPEPKIETAAPDVLSQDGSVLQFQREGTSAILATRGEELVDYRHFEALPIASLRFRRPGASVSELRISDAGEHSINAVPLDAQGRVLGGALSYQWRVLDDSVAELSTLDTVREVIVLGRRSGQTALEVTVGPLTATLPVTVELPAGRDEGDTQ